MPRTATVGPIYFEQVNELVAGGMKNSEAFRAVAEAELGDGASAEDLKKKERAIATTFYRLARLAAEGGDAPAPAAAPKKRGRPPKAKTEPHGAVAPKPVAVAVAKQNGYESDSLSALGQAKQAIDAAIVQAQAEATELAALRSLRDQIMGLAK